MPGFKTGGLRVDGDDGRSGWGEGKRVGNLKLTIIDRGHTPNEVSSVGEDGIADIRLVKPADVDFTGFVRKS